MDQRPFHHGNLRAVLLDRAEQTLREGGVDGLSLRELARQAGVSHGAPRSHFIDRQALLDAVAERGFERLTDALSQAGAQNPGRLVDRVRAVATAYVDFAVSDAALLQLMFSMKGSDQSTSLRVAAERMFSTFDALFEKDFAAGRFRGTDLERTKLFFVASLQGVAALITSHRISGKVGSTLIDEAADLFIRAPRDAFSPTLSGQHSPA